MDFLTFIHADSSLSEKSIVPDIISADMQIKSSVGADLIDNTFSITIPESVWESDPILE